MRIIKAKINGVWTEVGLVKTMVNNAYSGLTNLSGIAGNGEIAMHVADVGRPIGYAIQLSSNGTATIDWGDGTIETITATAYTNQTTANGLTAQVTHSYDQSNSSGKGIWIDELKTFIYTVRIYNASSAIKYFKIARVTSMYNEQHNGVLEAYLNLSSLVDISQMFSNGVSVTPLRAHLLKRITLSNADNVVKSDYFAYECISLDYYNFPSMPLATSRTYAFAYTQVRFDNINNLYTGASTSSMFNRFANGNLMKVIADAPNWGSMSDLSYAYTGNNLLHSVQLPMGVGNNKVTNCDNMFNGCNNIISFTGLEYLGSNSTNCSMSGTFDGLEGYTGTITINAKLTKFTCKGNSSAKNGVTGIRLLNANSPFSGTSSQIDVQYCDLSASALNTLFGDLPTVSGKTIKITGCTGAGTCDTSIATAKGWTVSN